MMVTNHHVHELYIWTGHSVLCDPLCADLAVGGLKRMCDVKHTVRWGGQQRSDGSWGLCTCAVQLGVCVGLCAVRVGCLHPFTALFSWELAAAAV
jgi:hypothetical protein